MAENILQIAVMCTVLGGASILLSFNVNSNPIVVWFGNALGSLISAVVVIYIGNRIIDKRFEDNISKRRMDKR